MNWNYGDAYLRHPIETGTAVFDDGSRLTAADITDIVPAWITDADLVFVDPPWNKGNLQSFYTKADKGYAPVNDFSEFYHYLFYLIDQISPRTAYVEVGKEYLPDFVMEMRKIFKHVTFYNSTYYHKPNNLCYIVRGSKKFEKPEFLKGIDGTDEEDFISLVCGNEDYSCVADLCVGRGLVPIAAARNGKRFVCTELNHKRLSVAIERLTKDGHTYKIEMEETK